MGKVYAGRFPPGGSVSETGWLLAGLLALAAVAMIVRGAVEIVHSRAAIARAYRAVDAAIDCYEIALIEGLEGLMLQTCTGENPDAPVQLVDVLQRRVAFLPRHLYDARDELIPLLRDGPESPDYQVT